MSWSPLQREALDAMGLSPLRLASATPTSMESASTARISALSGHERSTKAGTIDAMTAALLRAAGTDAGIGASEAVLALCPAPQSLRGDAGAKRALWPRLRALRKG